jgi:hypothetical protein
MTTDSEEKVDEIEAIAKQTATTHVELLAGEKK